MVANRARCTIATRELLDSVIIDNGFWVAVDESRQ